MKHILSGKRGRPIKLLLPSTSLFLLLLISGCSSSKHYNYIHPEVPRGTLYDLVWVEPEMIFSDSIFTLIRAERIDSLPLEKESDVFINRDASMSFVVDRQECFVNINLYDFQGQFVMPLLSRNLIYGYYKLSLVPRVLDESKELPRLAYLKGEVCGTKISQKIQ